MKSIDKITATLMLLLLGVATSCTDVDSERIPSRTVRIDISLAQQSNPDWWVNAPAEYVCYLYPDFPYDFPYTISSETGYGGVLLVCGYENIRYAYDLACPVEVDPSVIIYVDDDNLGHCKTCGSTYDVFWGSGAPNSGVAAEKKYSLRKYYISYSSSDQSYMILN